MSLSADLECNLLAVGGNDIGFVTNSVGKLSTRKFLFDGIQIALERAPASSEKASIEFRRNPSLTCPIG